MQTNDARNLAQRAFLVFFLFLLRVSPLWSTLSFACPHSRHYLDSILDLPPICTSPYFHLCLNAICTSISLSVPQFRLYLGVCTTINAVLQSLVADSVSRWLLHSDLIANWPSHK